MKCFPFRLEFFVKEFSFQESKLAVKKIVSLVYKKINKKRKKVYQMYNLSSDTVYVAETGQKHFVEVILQRIHIICWHGKTTKII